LEIPDVRDQPGFDDGPIGFGNSFGWAEERFCSVELGPEEPIFECVAVVQNKIQIVQQVESERRRRHGQIPCGLARARVHVLVPMIQGRREKRALPPLERVLSAGAVAEQGLTGAADDKNDFFKEMSLRLESLSRGNLAEIRVVGRVIAE
jgi:hypothetical protein